MRHGRAKAARRTLKFFSLHGGIQPTYKVLVDGNFLAAAIRQKVPIRDRLAKLLQNSPFTMHVTRSALDELDSIHKTFETQKGDVEEIEYILQARQWGLDECDSIIERSDVTELPTNNELLTRDKELRENFESLGEHGKHIVSLISMKNKGGALYFVATQDAELTYVLRNIPNVPLLQLSRGVLLMEAPSAASRGAANRDERSKLTSGGGTLTPEQRSLARSLRKQEAEKNSTNNPIQPKERAKKKAKGANPLSCKKSSTKSSSLKQKDSIPKRRRRSNAKHGTKNT
uniref:UTP23 sensor motif region domain-containing protein n=1 Tax=Attheya septentrionalis TaxID=420275 RepID=A0A7S2XLC3_9STRA|mmetsp:Transcript_18023/g.32678  ORF Transcript_18023/g.32678 Transcript_18023/m.32678 type:complete len:287 (+) Transcript_18023:130-990(+)|eukprot:CAMPEP_0198286328 /NCGR_PEP_ID=MMETSP1449-20131203/5444_1 /TAXON_ID=420275 /ORGANISM="Attheya septentrionalis, Strain CCMP2084" /LENGTH=286 /DNA_ID=CAMNT_0043984041 /DNA_START=98 /DNA_END=958 /DNA_ORIENTATION=-